MDQLALPGFEPAQPRLPRRKRRSALHPQVRFEVLKRDGFRCAYCGRKAPDVVLQVDHVIPVCVGGTDEVDNLITSCDTCNGGKGGRPLMGLPGWQPGLPWR